MSRHASIRWLLFLVAGSAVALVAGSALAEQGAEGSASAISSDDPSAMVRPSIPDLTEEERSRATEIALKDVHVQQLLSGNQHAVSSVGVWHTSKDLRKIGAGVIIDLAELVSIDADLPYANYDEAETSWPPYQRRMGHVSETNVRQIIVMVDLGTSEVVQITPHAVVEITPP